LSVDDQFQPTGEIEAKELPGGDYAVVTHRGSYSTLSDTWRQVFREWVPHSDRKVRSAPCFEVYLNDPASTQPEDLVTEIHVPLNAES
jgi:AraC family transcriptional regulator